MESVAMGLGAAAGEGADAPVRASDTAEALPFCGWDRVLPPERLHVRTVVDTRVSLMEARHIASLGEALSGALGLEPRR